MTNFYTAQYHTKLTPNLMSDVNGEYRRHDQTVARMPEGKSYYSTFSLWILSGRGTRSRRWSIPRW
ncbi:MAG: glycoside hydrolase domain-containing protein [Alistipes finegoldii]